MPSVNTEAVDPVTASGLRGLLDVIPVGLVFHDGRGRPLATNRLARDLLGDLAVLPLDRWLSSPRLRRADGQPASPADVPPLGTLEDGRPRRDVELSISRGREEASPVLCSAAAVLDADARPVQVVTVLTPITSLRQREEAVRHDLRWETIGKLAAGLAGPLNDSLTAITGYCDLARSRLEPGHALCHVMAEIRSAGERAAVLTGRMLAHSHREVAVPEQLDVDRWLRAHVAPLQTLMGRQIRLRVEPGAAGRRAHADPHILEPVLSDLVGNARDAMPAGGTLTVSTSLAESEPEVGRILGHRPAGEGYVRLSVSDTGGGIDEGVLPRIFEPFFTTKRGSLGLGLATVDRLVRAQGGFLRVENQRGEGATFHVYLPSLGAVGGTNDEAAGAAPRDGSRPPVVLLVEDDAMVRELVREILESQRYTVLEAHTAEEAIQLVEGREEPPDLLVSDVVLPGTGGPDLARRLRERIPGLRVLFMSGCSNRGLLAPAFEFGEAGFLAKPFPAHALVTRVASMLPGEEPEAPAAPEATPPPDTETAIAADADSVAETNTREPIPAES